MLSWIKTRMIAGCISEFAKGLAYQPSTRVQSIMSSLAMLTALCKEQLSDGEWDPDEKEVFVENVVREMMNLLGK